MQRREEYNNIKCALCTMEHLRPSRQLLAYRSSSLRQYILNMFSSTICMQSSRRKKSLEFRLGNRLEHTHTHNAHHCQSLFSTWNAETKIQCKICRVRKYLISFVLISVWCCCILLLPAPIDVQQNCFINAALPCKLD